MKGILYVLWYVLTTFSKPMRGLYAGLVLIMAGNLIYRIFFETRIAYLDWRELNYQIIMMLFVLMLPHYFQSLAIIGRDLLKIGQKQGVRHVKISKGGHGIGRKLHL